MGMEFTRAEGAALYGLLAEASDDVVFRLDADGFVIHASSALERLGIVLPDMLIGPHVADLASPAHQGRLRRAVARALESRCARRTEFAASGLDGRHHWFELQVNVLRDDASRTAGAMGLLRNIDERKTLEAKLLASAHTDRLTGLANRPAFLDALTRALDSEEPASLAILDIDHLRRINMAQGQGAGDRVLVLLADYLRNLVRPGDTVARIGGESFGLLLAGIAPDEAEEACRRVLVQLREIDAGHELRVTASAGLARVRHSVDRTMKQAELALFLAKARGRNRLEIDRALREPQH